MANIDTGTDGILNAGDKMTYSIAVTIIGSIYLTDGFVEKGGMSNITCSAVYSRSSRVQGRCVAR